MSSIHNLYISDVVKSILVCCLLSSSCITHDKKSYKCAPVKRTYSDRVLYNMRVAREVIPTSCVKVVYDVVDHKSINNIDDKIKAASNENHVRSVLTNFAVNNDVHLSKVLVESCKDAILTL